MSDIYAVVENEIVVNVILWDGESEWSPDNGVAIIADSGVSIGWSYVDEVFTPPPPPKPTPEDIAAKNLASAQSEYDSATKSINALNEQIADSDYNGTTEEAVKDELYAWTEYRKQLRAYINEGDGSKTPPSKPDI